MRILLDHGTPAPLRQKLPGHLVSTAYEMGWADLDNGSLLIAADGSFDIFITTDQNLRYRQNLTGRKLAIMVLPTTSWPKIQRHLPAIIAAMEAMQPIGKIQVRRILNHQRTLPALPLFPGPQTQSARPESYCPQPPVIGADQIA